jgi:1-acyl-sn-glycerol-3-phosphate acyltransferase
MIEARHHPLYERFFGAYTGLKMRRHFSSWDIEGRFTDGGKAVLLVGNHFSWWDGFIGQKLADRVFHRKIHVMMLEEQLSGRRFLSRLGAFSIRPGSRDALNSLRYATELLQNPGNLLLLFPQGRFESHHQFPLHFERGWFRIALGAPPETHLVFAANLTDWFASPRPRLFTYLQQHELGDFDDAGRLENAYNDFLGNAIGQQNQRI